MEELQSKLLHAYDIASSIWLTLGPQRQLAALIFVFGVLLFVLAVLRMLRLRRAPLRSKAAQRSEASEDAQSTSDVDATPSSGAAWFSGLRRTRRALATRLQEILQSEGSSKQQVFEQLEELLITSDMGVGTTRVLLDELKALPDATPAVIKAQLRKSIVTLLTSDSPPEIVPEKIDGMPLVVAVIGVNGVGKTTTIGKLAWQFGAQGKRVLIAAADTFRAAAEQQLEIWATRAGASIVRGEENAKPSTVAYQAVHQAIREKYDVLIIDTAGRLHTRVNLMNELQNVLHIVGRELPGSPHETILVLDASTGQNALQQARDFNACAPLTGIIVTKLDGTPKGGIVVAIAQELKIPIRYVGIGEQAADLKLFSAEEFSDALFAVETKESSDDEELEQPKEQEEVAATKRIVRRQRRTT